MSYRRCTLRLAGLVVLVLTASSLAGTPDCVTGTPTWQNLPIGTHGGYLVVQWDWTPNDAAVDGLVAVALAPPEPSVFDDYAAVVKLNPAGFFEVRDGAAYAFDQLLTYTADATYAVRAEINIPANTYSVWVTPAAAAEVLIATDYDFRTAQQGITELDTYGVWGDTGTHDACDFRVSASCSAPVGPAPSGTIFVDGSNPSCPGTGTPGDPLCSIQDAICFAVDGDEIVLAPGTYNETIDLLGKAITLRGSGGAEVTTIDGTGLDGSVITCISGEGAATLIEGLTVTGGTGESLPGIGIYGGGMLIIGANPTITGCTFFGNSADYGGGMAIQGAPLPVSINDCTFDENTGAFAGGGLYVPFGVDVQLSGCVFSLNDRGAIDMEGGSLTVDNCLFTANRNGSSAGGIYGSGGLLTATNSEWYGNESNAIYADANMSLTIDQCVFEANEGRAIIKAHSGTMYLSRSRFLRNRDGAIFIIEDSGSSIVDCEFSGNFARQAGGAIYLTQSSASVSNCTFHGNGAGLPPGGYQGGSTIFRGGGVAVPRFSNCILWGNGPDPIRDVGADDFNPMTLSRCIIQLYDGDQPFVITDQDPRLIDPLGPDGVSGTEDDDLRVFGLSPAVDAGDNGLVGADALDLDGDGDTSEPVPFDLASNPRFQDEPTVIDTGVGTPPIVDLGAHEWVPAIGTPSGPRWWNNSNGGAWSTAGNWLGGVPGPADEAVFDLSQTFTTTTPGAMQTRRLRVHDGDVLLDLNGGTYDLTASTPFAMIVAPTDEIQTPTLTLRDGSLSAGSVLVGAGPARLQVLSDSILDVATTETRGDGELAGTGVIVGGLTNLGRLDPGGDTIGSLLVGGDYTDVGQLPDGTEVAGNMDVTVDVSGNDALIVAGNASLGGAISINLFDPPLDTPIIVLTAGQITGEFRGAITGTALGGRTIEAPLYTDGRVEIIVREINLAATWDDGGDYSIGSEVVPTDAVLADFDNDMLPDIALTLPGDLDQVYVFFNNGSTKGGNPNDIFNDTPGEFCIVNVDNDPIALDAADLDNDGFIDLAVVNALGESLQILINDQDRCFVPPGPAETTSVGRPTDVITLSADADASPDLAVSSLGSSSSQSPQEAVVVYRNTGDGLAYDQQSVPVSGRPVALAAGPILDPAALVDDLAVVLNATDEVQLLANDGTGTVNTIGPIAVGTEPCYIEPEDIDRDGLLDLVIVNFGSSTLSVLLRKDGGVFDPTLSFAVGANPTSVTFADDGDTLALITSNEMGERVVDVYRNESDPNTVILELDEERFVGENPVIILAANVDENEGDDLIAITDPSSSGFVGAGGGGGGGGRGVGLGATSFAGFAAELQDPPCRADTDGNGSVGFNDLTGLLSSWGQSDLRYDFDENGTIGFGDLTILLNAWGPCS